MATKKRTAARRALEARYRASEKGKEKRREQQRRRMADPARRATRMAALAKWREENPDYHKQKSLEWRVKNAERQIWLSARKRAQERGLEFAIEVEDIVIPKVCPWLGIPLVVGEGRMPGSPSLDRIDNDKGYVPGNVEVISLRANWLKRDAILEELIAMGERAAELLYGK